jgi:hypothetical protein
MANITYELITDGNIEICRDLCNALMAFQKEQATIGKEAFDMMNFDTRMKVSYAGALRAHVVVAKDGDKAVGYIFSTIDETPEEARGYFPPWAPKGEGFIGFYPEWLELPQNGHLKAKALLVFTLNGLNYRRIQAVSATCTFFRNIKAWV